MIKRIEIAIEIINSAINNKISVKKASQNFGYNETYVKNVKADVYKKFENEEINNDDFNEFVNTYKKYLDSKSILNISNGGILNETGRKNFTNGKTSYTFKGNEGEIEWVSGSNYPPNHIKTLDDLLKETKVKLDLWNVKDFTINKWDVTSFKKEFPETIQNFQIKARLEKNVELANNISAADVFIDLVKNYTPPFIQIEQNKQLDNQENNLLEISIFDLHLGKLAHIDETGENFDTKIASERFIYSINKLLERASGFNFSKIVFPIGNDFFNSDNQYNTTANGTQQHEDLRWQKTFKIGTQLIIDGINILKQTGCPIDVIVISGNHDTERSYYLGSVLEAWFNNDAQVNIDNGFFLRKYYNFGEVLLGYTHGKYEKEASLPQLMATEAKELWGKTTYKEWHIGHKHKKMLTNYVILDKSKTINEDFGVTVRMLSSLTGTEHWHYRQGFVGVIKAADGFIWNDKLGLVAHLNSNIVFK